MKELLHASVRVCGERSGPPDPKRVRQAGEQLSRLGFEVLRLGRRGISIGGAPEQFEGAFGVHFEPGIATTTKVQPRDARLKGLIDYLEIAPKPVSF